MTTSLLSPGRHLGCLHEAPLDKFSKMTEVAQQQEEAPAPSNTYIIRPNFQHK